jgi:hypothetical protein
MKGLFAMLGVLVLLAAVFVGVGFYQGWFHVATAGTDGNPGATITVDQDKIKADAEAAKEKAKDLQDKAKDKTDAPANKDKEEPHKP